MVLADYCPWLVALKLKHDLDLEKMQKQHNLDMEAFQITNKKGGK